MSVKIIKQRRASGANMEVASRAGRNADNRFRHSFFKLFLVLEGDGEDLLGNNLAGLRPFKGLSTGLHLSA